MTNSFKEPALIEIPSFSDQRGDFIKLFQIQDFLDFKVAESFISYSRPGVLRGMHLQVGSAAHNKICICLQSSILDVIVDVRTGPTKGKVFQYNLDESKSQALLIPKGYAHGFYNKSKNEKCAMMYFVDTIHDKRQDTGVRWNSIDFEWPNDKPILSERDKNLVSIDEFTLL